MVNKNKYPFIEVIGEVKPNDFCIIDSRVHGLFATFYCILYGLYICEEEKFKPVVSLGENHLYFDRKYGKNIFNYFFTQRHTLNNKNTGKIIVLNPSIFLKWCRISTNEKYLSNNLLKKYFLLKNSLLSEINDFVEINYSNSKVLGVHFRGRDKIKETKISDFNEYIKKIEYFFDNNICDKIFFATDELQYRDSIKKIFKNKAILYCLNNDYSNMNGDKVNGLHLNPTSPYLHAKDALIECHLLSRCQLLLSSSKSSMSIFATFINPQIGHCIIEP